MNNPSPAINAALSKTVVIIPARNEERSIGLVLDDLPDVGLVIVVDNGSTDDTSAIAKSKGCTVISEPVPGYGRACLTGMNYLQSVVDAGQIEADYVGFIDADYSDHPQELTQMLRVVLGEQVDDVQKNESSVDFVLGSRMLGTRENGAMHTQALFGNWLACSLMRLFWGAEFTDLGPFRLIRYDKLMSLEMQDLNFGWTIEMQIKATLARLKITEIPASYRRRIGVSKISGTLSGTIRAGYKILYTIARFVYLSKFRRRWFDTTLLPARSTMPVSTMPVSTMPVSTMPAHQTAASQKIV